MVEYLKFRYLKRPLMIGVVWHFPLATPSGQHRNCNLRRNTSRVSISINGFVKDWSRENLQETMGVPPNRGDSSINPWKQSNYPRIWGMAYDISVHDMGYGAYVAFSFLHHTMETSEYGKYFKYGIWQYAYPHRNGIWILGFLLIWPILLIWEEDWHIGCQHSSPSPNPLLEQSFLATKKQS